MNRQQISARFDGFLRLQALCVAIIAAVWGIFWAMERPGGLTDISIYVLIQVNLSFLVLKPLRFLYSDSRSPYRGVAHWAIILTVTAIVVMIATAVDYRVNGAHGPFLPYLRSGWKFPFVANMVFSFGFETYYLTKCRLETRNLQLQQTIASETAEREQQAAELKQALEIQRGLLPKEVPQLRGFEIAGGWEPARVVGGDYYDVIRLSRDKLAVCIADVAGKGISAALLMANVQAAVRAFAADEVSPSRVCAQINSVLCTNIAPGKFVTLFYGVLDGRTRTLQFTNAGHPSPLLIRRGKTSHLENEGALLGVFPDWKYEDSSVDLEPGDLLLLFTDGITEATATEGEEFGEGRLVDAFAGAQLTSLDELQSRVFDQVKDFCNSRISDDATLLMVAVPAAGAQGLAHAEEATRQVLEHAGVPS